MVIGVKNKVSCVLTTYKRFTCVERSITWFLSQDYQNYYDTLTSELLIYNTDSEYPLYLDGTFDQKMQHKIKIINTDTDLKTGKSYTNVGAIRRDAQTFADGEFYITWDDDDIFFPWNIRQCYDGVQRTQKEAWKPRQSLYKESNKSPELAENILEASILVKMNTIDMCGFNLETGAEHLQWFNYLCTHNQMCVDEYSIPGYCFYWSDTSEVGGHKNSSTIDNPNNFELHKQRTTDGATRALTRRTLAEYRDLLEKFDPILLSFRQTKPELFSRYIQAYLSTIDHEKYFVKEGKKETYDDR